ncbi:MAG: DoxX family protein [Phycisphaerales bacterium JB064]
MTTGQRIDVAFTLFVRVFLAGVFGFAAYMKLRNDAASEAFAESIQAFDVLDAMQHHHLVTLATFAVPWLEVLCGVLILFGLWTRAAAFSMLAALGVFMWAIYSVIARGLNIECGCFGDFSFPCGDAVGACQLWRNGVLAALCLFLLIRGGGRASLDAAFAPTKGSDDDLDPQPQPAPARPSRAASDEGSIPLDPARPAPLSSRPTGQPPADQPSKPRWD